MSKKTNKVNVEKTNKVEEQDVINDTVYVRVVKNFNDATDNERFISAGPNSYYKTDRERADMLVRAGYAEYDSESTIVNTNVGDNNDTVITNEDIDNGNGNDITNDNVNDDDNTSDEENANDDSEDTNVDGDNNVNDDNNTNNEDIPNE